MNLNYAHKLAEIIIKVWIDKASEEEREKLLSWLDESEENRQTYKDIISGKTLQRRIQEEEDITANTNYLELSKSIAQKLLKRNSQRHYLRRVSYVAGSVILFLTAWLLWPVQKEQPQIVQLQDSKVKLILPSGDIVNLDKNEGEEVDIKSANYVEKSNEIALESEITNKIITEAGGEYSFLLSDGTRVWLNSSSEIEFPVEFLSNTRVVNLTGEAYFEVVPDKSKPFIVHSHNQTVEVLGTSFNIKAYPQESKIYTTLVNGSITVGSGGNKIVLSPGMESVCSKNTNAIEVQPANIEFSTAWREGYFMFDEEELQEIIVVLARWYDYSFDFDLSKEESSTFSGRFNKRNSLRSILNALALTGGPEFIINEETKTVTLK